MKPKLLFIGHTYHKKTKSSQFMQDILSNYYDIENFYFDPYTEDMQTAFKVLNGRKFDVLVLWQIMPEIDRLKKYISFEHAAFFPMYDGVPPRSDRIWYQYRNVNIISFSKTLHDELKNLGFSSYYFQYFPKPIEITDFGNEKSVFFWQRINDITINTVGRLIDFNNLEHIHMHRAIDPSQTFVEPPVDILSKVTSSTWFDTREDMQKQMQKSAIYIAPRMFEGIGMSFLEAMAMGRCVIAPNYPTMNEYIKDGENGILYDLNNIKPVDLSRVREIQEKTKKYIESGYEVWEKQKYKIVSILSTLPKINKRSLIKKYTRQYEIDNVYSLFDMVPLVRIVGKPGHITYKLFGFLPFLLIKGGKDRKRIYVFGIPLIKMKG